MIKIYLFFIVILISCSRDWSNPLSPDGNNNQYLPPAGLVEYYPFNGNTNDVSGNENHGIIHGNSALFVPGRFDQSIKFDNKNSGIYTVNDYIDLPKISINELTVSHWVKFIGGSSTSYSGCTYSIGEYPVRTFLIIITNSGTVGGQIIVNNIYYNTATIDISDHEWRLITVTVSYDFMKIFENGSLINSVNLGFNLNFKDAFQQVALHRFSGSMSSRFTGELDNLLIYNRSMNLTEVQGLFNK